MNKTIRYFLEIYLSAGVLSSENVQQITEHTEEGATLESVVEVLLSAHWIQNDDFLHHAMEQVNASVGDRLENEHNCELTGEMPDLNTLAGLSDSALLVATKNLMIHCQRYGGSDLHLTAGARIRMRFCRKILYISQDVLDSETALRMNCLLLSDVQKKEFEENWDLDYALSFPSPDGSSLMRYRVHLMQMKRGVSGVYHFVPEHIPTLEQLGFTEPAVIRQLLTYHNGIIIITGPVGSGKTTTLAALVHELNKKRHDHIITIEDPIEVVVPHGKCIVTQRQVGEHTTSFYHAVQSSLREDPDIIVIGELRDLETIEMAITAAETGHLVIVTMHTKDSTTTLTRLLDVFPALQQPQIRAMASGSLRGIICQRLLPGAQGGLVLANELLINNGAVANIIREAKETGLKSVLQTNKKMGMCLMDDSIMDLFKSGKITADTANTFIEDKNSLKSPTSQKK